MTRSIQLHPFSVLVGLGIAVMAFVTMAQSADLQGTQNVAVVNPVQIAPHPRHMVQILPYVTGRSAFTPPHRSTARQGRQ